MIITVLKNLMRGFYSSLLLVISLMLAFVFYLGFTNSGFQTTLSLVRVAIPTLHIEQGQGILFSHFTLRNVSFLSSKNATSLNTVTIAWDFKELFNGKFSILHTSIDKLIVQSFNTNEPNSAHNNLEILIEQQLKTIKWYMHHLSLHHLMIGSLELFTNQKPTLRLNQVMLNQEKQTVYFSTAANKGTLEGKIYLSTHELPTWGLDIKAQHLDLAENTANLSSDVNFDLSATGKKKTLHLHVNNLYGKIRNQLLKGRIDFDVHEDNIQIHQGNLQIGNAYIEMSGEVTKDWNIHWKANIPNLTDINGALKGRILTTGDILGEHLTPTINATIGVDHFAFGQYTLQQLNITTHFIFKPDILSRFDIQAANLSLDKLKLKKINLHLTEKTHVTASFYQMDLAISDEHTPYLNANIQVPTTATPANIRTQPIDMHLVFAKQNVQRFESDFTFLHHPTGILDGAMQVTGTLKNPQLKGQVNLTNASVALPQLGIDVQHIQLNVQGDASGMLHYIGSFQINQAVAKLEGSTNLNKQFDTTLSLHGNHLQIANLSTYKVTVSPDLEFNYLDKVLSIKGNLLIPEASITPKDFTSTIDLPSETVFVGAPKTSTQSVLSSIPNLQVHIELGSRIHISYQHLVADLMGNIVVSKNPRTLVTAVGQLYTTKGTYEAYGQALTIKQGKLIYTGGEINNPGLNISAIRKLKTVQLDSGSNVYTGRQTLTVGVQVLGTLNTPTTSLFSNPATLDQANILSYLMLGVPLPQASQDNQAKLTELGENLAAASAMNFGGGSSSGFGKFASNLQSGLGLSELNVGSVQTFDPSNTTNNGVSQTTSIIIGKQLTKNLYVQSSVGIFNQAPVISLRYKLSKHWSVQSEASMIDNGGDLLYSIERE